MITFLVGAIKGGTGKTTLTYNLAGAFLAKYPDANILLIDCDPQSSLSILSGASLEGATVKELLNGTHVRECVQFCGPFAVIPARSDLTDVRPNETALVDALKPVQGYFDYCFIDTRPALAQLTRAALAAADRVIMPVLPDMYAGQAIIQFMTQCTSVKDINPGLTVDGVVLNMCEKWSFSTAAGEFISDLAGKMGTKVYNTHLGKYAAYNTAVLNKRLPVAQAMPKSVAAVQLQALADEILTGVEEQ